MSEACTSSAEGWYNLDSVSEGEKERERERERVVLECMREREGKYMCRVYFITTINKMRLG